VLSAQRANSSATSQICQKSCGLWFFSKKLNRLYGGTHNQINLLLRWFEYNKSGTTNHSAVAFGSPLQLLELFDVAGQHPRVFISPAAEGLLNNPPFYSRYPPLYQFRMFEHIYGLFFRIRILLHFHPLLASLGSLFLSFSLTAFRGASRRVKARVRGRRFERSFVGFRLSSHFRLPCLRLIICLLWQ
jgi:hypothetical protein